MTIEEAVESGKELKLEGNEWLYVRANGCICYKGTILPATFTKKDVLSNKWIVKEEWYEGDFKAKYPAGVLCKVSDDEVNWILAIITLYGEGEDYPFFTNIPTQWTYAKPVPKEEMPFVLTEDN